MSGPAQRGGIKVFIETLQWRMLNHDDAEHFGIAVVGCPVKRSGPVLTAHVHWPASGQHQADGLGIVVRVASASMRSRKKRRAHLERGARAPIRRGSARSSGLRSTLNRYQREGVPDRNSRVATGSDAPTLSWRGVGVR